MTQENLEEKTSQAEGAEATPKEEVKPTENEEKSTVSVVDTPEFKKALDRAVGKGVASIQSQLSVSKASEASVKAALGVSESMQEETQKMLQDLEEKQFAEDPDALKGYRNTKSLELREKKATLREEKTKLVEIEQDGFRNAIALDGVAKEIMTRYQVPRKILELCNSKEQMEDIASDYPEVGKKPEEKTPKFAGAGEDKGTNLKDMSPDEKLKYGFRQLKK